MHVYVRVWVFAWMHGWVECVWVCACNGPPCLLPAKENYQKLPAEVLALALALGRELFVASSDVAPDQSNSRGQLGKSSFGLWPFLC